MSLIVKSTFELFLTMWVPAYLDEASDNGKKVGAERLWCLGLLLYVVGYDAVHYLKHSTLHARRTFIQHLQENKLPPTGITRRFQ